MSAVVLGAMGLLGALLNRQSRQMAETLATALLAQKIQHVEGRIGGLLSSAERQGRACRELTPEGGLAPDDYLKVFVRLAATFAQQEEFTYLGYAVEATGEYIMLERRDTSTCRLREYLLLPSGERVMRRHRVTRDGFELEKTEPWDGYDPRTRPFYQKARSATGPAWTSSYLFKGNDWHPEMLGVTYVVPVRDRAGALLGVWDVDFDMRELSRFLKEKVSNETGHALVMEMSDAGPVLIAHPKMSMGEGEGGTSPLDPVVPELTKFLRGGAGAGGGMVTLRIDEGEGAKLVACQRLQTGGPPWLVAVVFDEATVMAKLERNRQWIWMLVLGVTGLAVLTAAWLAHVLWRPVEQLRAAAEGLAGGSGLHTVPVEGPRELARLAETYNTMARAVEARRRELLATNLRLQEEVRQRGLREAELEAVFANAPVEIWAVDTAGRYTLQSRRLRERCGEAIGSTPEELSLPGDVSEAYSRNNRRALGGETVRGETTEVSEGREAHYHWIVSPIRIGGLVTGALGVSIDVTERRRAEDALWRSQQRLRLHLENTPLAVIDWSMDMVVLSWNPAAEAVFGWSAEEALGRHGLFIVLEAERAEIKEVWADLLARRGGYRHYNQNLTKDGRVIDCEWYNTVLTDENERVIGVSSLVLDVSQRLSAEALFRESEERFLHAFKASPVAKIISRRSDGTILDANDHFLQMIDHRREDVVGRTSMEVGIWDNPSDRAMLLQALDRDGEIRDREYRLRPRTGAPVDVIVSAAAVPLGKELCLLVTFVDNTERKQAEGALRESQRFLAALIGHLPGMVYRCRNDKQWTMTFVSNGAKELTGYSPADLEHNRVIDFASLVHPEDRDRLWRETQAAITNGRNTFSYEYRIRHRSGEVRWVWERGEAQAGADGSATTLVGFITDISERKNAEDEVLMLNLSLERRVEERTAELAAANEQLKELDRLKSEFLATMSHELRTPLNSIIGFSSILRQGLAGSLNPEQQKQIDLVRGSARHLLSLINDLLDLSRIESGRMELSTDEFDLAGVLSEVEAVLAPMVAQRGLAYASRCEKPPVRMRSDRQRVFQVILNLANDAVKFTEHGGVTVECDATASEVSVRVRDTGIGIRSEHLPLLFEAFRQVDGSARRIYEGTGLGLHLCRKLLDLLGGRIEVESVYQKGTCFTVTLPRGSVKPGGTKPV
ncbi:MAG: PAS domain S-box protein [Nibricoccus sp.]